MKHCLRCWPGPRYVKQMTASSHGKKETSMISAASKRVHWLEAGCIAMCIKHEAMLDIVRSSARPVGSPLGHAHCFPKAVHLNQALPLKP